MTRTLYPPVVSKKKPKKKQAKPLDAVPMLPRDDSWIADTISMLSEIQRLDPSQFAYATGLITGLHLGVTSRSCRPRLELIKDITN